HRRLSLPSLSPELDPRGLVNDVPRLCGIVLDRGDDAGKNQGKVSLRRYRRKTPGEVIFLRFRGHLRMFRAPQVVTKSSTRITRTRWKTRRPRTTDTIGLRSICSLVDNV